MPGLLAVIVVIATAMAFAVCAHPTSANWFRGDAVPATSEYDPVLIAGLVKLSPSVSPDEARRVAFTAYTTGRQLAAEWRMVSPATEASSSTKAAKSIAVMGGALPRS